MTVEMTSKMLKTTNSLSDKEKSYLGVGCFVFDLEPNRLFSVQSLANAQTIGCVV